MFQNKERGGGEEMYFIAIKKKNENENAEAKDKSKLFANLLSISLPFTPFNLPA